MAALEALNTFALPLGFGFHPSDVELISHYLKRKILGLKIDNDVIEEIDICKHEPWDLPGNYANFYFLLVDVETLCWEGWDLGILKEKFTISGS